jgi:hypothetical protein
MSMCPRITEITWQPGECHQVTSSGYPPTKCAVAIEVALALGYSASSVITLSIIMDAFCGGTSRSITPYSMASAARMYSGRCMSCRMARRL